MSRIRLRAAALMATLVTVPVLAASPTFVFTAIPDQDETRLVERFNRFAKYLEPKLGVPVKYVPVRARLRAGRRMNGRLASHRDSSRLTARTRGVASWLPDR